MPAASWVLLLLVGSSSFVSLSCNPTLTCAEGSSLCGERCAELQTDAAHCGACDRACSDGKVCVSGKCTTTCSAEKPDRCGAGAAAFCTDFRSDKQNCGACDNACPGSGSFVCQDGRCAISCGPTQPTACPTVNPDHCTNVATDAENCAGCGKRCKLDHGCTDGACTLCTPTVATATAPAGPIPSGLKVTCLSSPCPVVKCGQVTYWLLSYIDNRSSYALTGYDRHGLVKGPAEKPGDRYINTITLDSVAQTATLTGQSSTMVLPWSEFRMP